MALPLNMTLTVSCDVSEEDSGPTIVHSTGVQNYRIHPGLIQILQGAFGNERLCDHEEGVQCTDPAANVIEAFENAGFSVEGTSESGDRKIWMLIKTSADEE
ncbi:unnamed protein product [Rotaria sp. Silwood1]|nr:unnamed protein product [Rotaria sp. Silwood1]CAF0968898.1 unnamed protein product [Rotaria sp. Silwood1]CAF3382390.1 unnamed protein product [Rotaria sp. Silwood1]CAF4579832.1 unnamed protein product [Rotaria sp. Silwood1]CAF4840108.1 unnamed protein product [Rotaria sp. Silwood1]